MHVADAAQSCCSRPVAVAVAVAPRPAPRSVEAGPLPRGAAMQAGEETMPVGPRSRPRQDPSTETAANRPSRGEGPMRAALPVSPSARREPPGAAMPARTRPRPPPRRNPPAVAVKPGRILRARAMQPPAGVAPRTPLRAETRSPVPPTALAVVGPRFAAAGAVAVAAPGAHRPWARPAEPVQLRGGSGKSGGRRISADGGRGAAMVGWPQKRPLASRP